MHNRHKYHNGELKEPDGVVGDGEGDDEDDKEPAMTHFGRLNRKISIAALSVDEVTPDLTETLTHGGVPLKSHSNSSVDTTSDGNVYERNKDGNNSKDWKVLDRSQVRCSRVNQVCNHQEQGVADSLDLHMSQ